MTGWWSLGERAVMAHTWPGWLGAYLLANSLNGVVRYVGWSDTEVRSRLLQHAANGEYRYFWVEHIANEVDAFLRECGLYHHYRRTLDNAVHPRRPTGCGDACPRCSMYD